MVLFSNTASKTVHEQQGPLWKISDLKNYENKFVKGNMKTKTDHSKNSGHHPET